MLASLKKLLPSHRAALAVRNNGERQAGTSLADISRDHLLRYEFAAAFAKQQGLSKALDAACGCGYGSYVLSSSGLQSISAVDVSQEAIDYAKKHYQSERIQHHCQDVCACSFRDDAFDLVVSFETIEHIPQIENVLRKFRDWITPDGYFIGSTPNERRMPFSSQKFPFHVRHYTPEEVEDMLTSVGFKLQSMHCQVSKQQPDIITGNGGNYLVFVAQPDS